MSEIANKVRDIFYERFNKEPALYSSPGRINLIGEHIDYNDGFVMPGAIDKGIYYGVALNHSGTFNFYSVDFEESLSIRKEDIQKLEGWKNYVLGVVNEFLLAGKDIPGFDCVFGGDIANGAGISSSAAVEGGIAFSLNDLLNLGYGRKELALLGQRAEHSFPGVMCGIMDQYANMFGKADHVMLLDCQQITHEYLPLRLNEQSLVLINSNVHHSLASSEYNKRREECEAGLYIMRSRSGISSFRDILNPEVLSSYKEEMGEVVYKRCLYVVEEILRTKKAAVYLQENNIDGFGKLMFQTHAGLKDLYEVSCPELDFLVSHASGNRAVIGSRLMGGGFGGCTINIIRDAGKDQFIQNTITAYKASFNIDPEIYEVRLVDGTHKI